MLQKTKKQIAASAFSVLVEQKIGDKYFDDQVYNFHTEDEGTEAACEKSFNLYDSELENNFTFYRNSDGFIKVSMFVNGELVRSCKIEGSKINKMAAYAK